MLRSGRCGLQGGQSERRATGADAAVGCEA